MQVPDDLIYTESHEWIRVEDGQCKVGITEFAQSQLADLTFVDLPEAGSEVSAGDEVAVVESVKAASDVYAPLSGTITEVNSSIQDAPEMINEDSFGDGWLFVIKPDQLADLDGLLSPEAYRELLPGE